MKDNPSPFVGDLTQQALKVFKSATNSEPHNFFQCIAIIMCPAVIAALPAFIIADTLAFPYDYYLKKKTEKTRVFWNDADNEFRKEEDNPYPIEKYEAYFGDYASYKINKWRWFESSKLQEKYATIFFTVSYKHGQYNFATSMGNNIASSNNMTGELATKLYEIVNANPKKCQHTIISFLKNRLVPAQIKEKLYAMLLSDKYKDEVSQLQYLGKMKYYLDEKGDLLNSLKMERRMETLAVRGSIRSK